MLHGLDVVDTNDEDIEQDKLQMQHKQSVQGGGGGGGRVSLQEITCFRCGEQGHYANHCSKKRKLDDGTQN